MVLIENPNRRKSRFYAEILGPRVENWLSTSYVPRTRMFMRAKLGLVCEKYKVTPDQLVKMSREETSTFLARIRDDFRAEGKSAGYFKHIYFTIKGWRDYNDQPTKKVKTERTRAKYGNEQIPSNGELKACLTEGNLRARAAMALMAFGGVRPEVIGSWTGKDGLRVEDLPELRIADGRASFGKVPAMVKVRAELSKTGNEYFTFLSGEGCDILKDYLEKRMAQGEEVGPESPIFTAVPQRGEEHFGRFVVTVNVAMAIRKAFRNSNRKWRPYVLRRYFAHKMMDAEAEGLTLRDWRTFWMGHRGDMEAVYTVNKGLAQAEVERMRAGYAKAAEAHLSTSVGLKDVQTLDSLRKELKAREEEIEKLKASAGDAETRLRREMDARFKEFEAMFEEIKAERRAELAAKA
jgi:hypothetical protein